MATPTIPKGRQYSGFYFDGVLDALFALKKLMIPRHTETALEDPLNALLVEQAFEGHRWSAQLDVVATERYLEGAQRRASMVALARAAGRRLARERPARVDVLCTLRGTPGATEVVLPTRAKWYVPGDAERDAVTYEYTGDDVVVGDLELTAIAEDSPGVFGAPVAGDSIGAPWASVAAGDALYVGHPELQVEGFLRTSTAWNADQQVWEYYDGHYARLAPGAVADNGDGTLTLRLDAALGVAVRTDLQLRVQSMATGRRELVTVVAGDDDTNEATTATYLGQTDPSANPQDYLVTGEWLPLDVTLDATNGTTRTFTFDLPQGENARWTKATVGGVEGYWFRERVVAPAVAVAGVEYLPLDDATWYLLATCTQGETVDDQVGVTTGDTFQRLALRREPYIEGSLTTLDVGGDANWIATDSTYGSGAEDKVFAILELSRGQIVIEFGDGINGRVPPPALDVSASYRVGATADGNVGVGQVRDGGPGTDLLSNFTNPRPAVGWQAMEAVEGDDTSMNRARRDIAGGQRAANRIVTPEDAQVLVAGNEPNGFQTEDERRPFARVIAIEGGAGPKTMRLVVVGAGGAVPDSTDMDELDTFLNGRQVGLQRIGGMAMANQRISSVPYVERTITLAVTLTVLPGYERGASTLARAALEAGLHPLAALRGSYLWLPGMVIGSERLQAIMAGAVPGYFSSSLGAYAPVTLAANELPVLGVGTSITVLTASL